MKSPLFFWLKMSRLIDIVREHLISGMVLLDMKYYPRTNLIKVVVDAETPLTIDDTAAVTRSLRHAGELENQFPDGFRVEVSTPGLNRPLTAPFQYRKNRGRFLNVQYVDNNKDRQISGKVLDADSEKVSLDVNGKKHVVSFDNISKATVKISFG